LAAGAQPQVQEVLAPDGHGPEGTLGGVVLCLDAPVADEARQGAPVAHRIADMRRTLEGHQGGDAGHHEATGRSADGAVACVHRVISLS